MKKLVILLVALVTGVGSALAAHPKRYIGPQVCPDSTELSSLSEFSTTSEIARALADSKVVIGKDTVSMILPERNYGRYDRGLYNFLFIPKGQWAFGLTASYGELNTEDIRLLSYLKDLSLKGKMYSVKPTVSYFFKNNRSIGLRFNYTRGDANLNGMSVNISDDIDFTLSDVSYYSQNYGVSVFYRNYIGLSTLKRFAIFNEVDLSVSSGLSRFNRLYNGEPRNTRTVSTSASLNFSPGLCMFIMDYISFQVSFGVFGFHITHDTQSTNGVEEGSRTSSGANFRFNLFNINFGIGVHI